MTTMESGRVIDRYLDEHDVEAFGHAIDTLRRRVRAQLGAADIAYIRRIMRLRRRLEIGGRLAIHVGVMNPLCWLGGVGALAMAKILDNMEIGHNLMHGQYEWSGEADLGSHYDWDSISPNAQWRHSHNIIHHRYTNILGVDRDIGYGALRMAEAQPWRLRYLPQPLLAFLMSLTFEWGVGFHDVELDRLLEGRWCWREFGPRTLQVLRRTARLMARDYLLYPALAGPFFLSVLLGNLAANVARNIWTFTIIFCGHFPEGTEVFSAAECQGESRGAWYVRQLLGSCNIDGGRWFHLMTGHLSHQIEHHLFPALPAHRYPQLAPAVQALCRQYGLPYHTGPLRRQFGSVLRRIWRLSLPRGTGAPAPRSNGRTDAAPVATDLPCRRAGPAQPCAS